MPERLGRASTSYKKAGFPLQTDSVRQCYDNLLCHFERSEKSSIMLVEAVLSHKTGNSDGLFRPDLGAARVFEDFSFRFAPFEMTFGRTQST